MFKHIDHIALHVNNLNVSQDFYCQYFGFKLHFSETLVSGIKTTYLTLGDTMLELTKLPNQMISGMHFCLKTENFTDAFNYLKNQGIKINRAPHPTSARIASEKNWQRAVFLGPDQEQIEIRGPI
ncbi:VOC family protein [Piscirickettsia litoralis]|uniref:VOC domain-containing protein n=1 Tax=Piscirickettsia litoralis TaxID=1891921 RepID=A0ABX3A466_9GAMM|nr:VOC family protein [Piscirickettsia litoralis]ODN43661.1 hypothetical protein BGC07_13050 [Piscirickettsia litoralis]